MRTKLKQNKMTFLALTIILFGAFLRFYNLNWGAPFYFHPDERNIAGLISSLPAQIDYTYFLKGTFAYGNFISNAVFFIRAILSSLLTTIGFSDPFIQSVILLRYVSAISSLLTILIVFYIGYRLKNLLTGIVSATLSAFSTGLIQAAHFGVYESFFTLMSAALFLISMLYIKSKSFFYIFISIIIISVSSASKINSIIFILFPFSLFSIISLKQKIALYKIIFQLLLLLLFFMILTLFLSPYYATEEFRNLFIYERNLLTGALPVFYTSEFFNTTPILFQLTHIYPFLINPLLTLLFVPSFLYVFYDGIKNKKINCILLSMFFIILFLPSALLFAKWTRYMVPTLPFMYLIIAIALEDFLRRKVAGIKYTILSIIIFINIAFAVSYFVTAFVNQDTRIEASLWAKENIPTNSRSISEVYDMGIVPFNPYLHNISLFNFYDLDPVSDYNSIQLQNLLSSSEYIILPSQRILKTRLINQKKFPNGYNFYSGLLSGKLGYQKVYETPCNIFCKIIYLGDPVFSFEITANIFDRPTVFIFKKIK